MIKCIYFLRNRFRFWQSQNPGQWPEHLVPLVVGLDETASCLAQGGSPVRIGPQGKELFRPIGRFRSRFRMDARLHRQTFQGLRRGQHRFAHRQAFQHFVLDTPGHPQWHDHHFRLSQIGPNIRHRAYQMKSRRLPSQSMHRSGRTAAHHHELPVRTPSAHQRPNLLAKPHNPVDIRLVVQGADEHTPSRAFRGAPCWAMKTGRPIL